MRKEIRFKLDDSSSFTDNAVSYFKQAGFRVVKESPNEINVTKGNILQNMVALNPLNWKSDVKVTYFNREVLAIFEVNTFGQMITPKDDQLWDTFVGNFKRSLTEKVDLKLENEKEIRETKKSNQKYVKWAIIGAIVCGIPSGLIAYYTGFHLLAAIGSAGGASLGVFYKVSEDQKKVSK